MDIKEESYFPDLCSENEGDSKNLIKKVKIETVTSSSDIKSEIEDSTCSESEKHHLMRFNENIKESEIDTKIDIKEEDCWLRRVDSYTNDIIKDEADEDVYSTKLPRLVPEVKNSNITCSNNFEMDPIKEEESFPDHVAPQNETEFFPKVITMKRNSDAVLVDDCCDVLIKTEIKSEAPFTKHFIKQIKSEALACSSSSSWEIDRKAVIDEETLISDFGSQSREAVLPEDPVAKLGKFNSGEEMGNKIEIKEQSLWPQTHTSDMRDDSKHWEFPPVNSSRLCTRVSSNVSAISPLIAAEASGRATSFYPGKDHPECECRKSDDTEIPSAQEDVLSEQCGKCSEKMDMYIRPLNLKQKTLIHKCERLHKYRASDKSFTQLSYLKTHNQIQEGNKPHQCKTCDKSFTELSNLKRHYLIHEGKKPHQCKTCFKSFRRLSDLKRHSLIHEGKKPHQCTTCDKSFTQLSSLKSHSFIHKNEKPYKCKSCDRSFTRLSDLKEHCLIHEDKKPHQCETCDKRFKRLSYLKRHSWIHEGKKPHQCKTCYKRFTQLSSLKTHSFIHEAEKPHQCKICDKSFHQRSYLKRHYLVHEDKKPHQCKTCDKRFRRLSELKIHSLIHEGKKPHQCKTCDKRFRTSSELKIHSLNHEGKKPHQCKTCDKRFTRLSYLKTHSLIHEDRKPHQCKTCFRSFKRLSDLKRHSSIHEGEKP